MIHYPLATDSWNWREKLAILRALRYVKNYSCDPKIVLDNTSQIGYTY